MDIEATVVWAKSAEIGEADRAITLLLCEILKEQRQNAANRLQALRQAPIIHDVLTHGA